MKKKTSNLAIIQEVFGHVNWSPGSLEKISRCMDMAVQQNCKDHSETLLEPLGSSTASDLPLG